MLENTSTRLSTYPGTQEFLKDEWTVWIVGFGVVANVVAIRVLYGPRRNLCGIQKTPVMHDVHDDVFVCDFVWRVLLIQRILVFDRYRELCWDYFLCSMPKSTIVCGGDDPLFCDPDDKHCLYYSVCMPRTRSFRNGSFRTKHVFAYKYREWLDSVAHSPSYGDGGSTTSAGDF